MKAKEGAHWPIEVVDALIGVEQRFERCWRVNRYLGSMMSFDFGGRIKQPVRHGVVEVGTSALGIRDCYWTAEGDGFERISSDSIDAVAAGRLNDMLTGATLTGCSKQNSNLHFNFSNSVRFELDLTNRHELEPDDVIAELKLKGGAVLILSSGGRFAFDVAASTLQQREIA